MRKPLAPAALFFAVTLSSLAGCERHLSEGDYELRESMSSEDIPTSVDKAVERMDQLFPEATNDALLRCESGTPDDFCREFTVRIRLSLTRQISNEWMRPEKSPLADAYSRKGITNPEEMSYSLVAAYVEYLKSTS